MAAYALRARCVTGGDSCIGYNGAVTCSMIPDATMLSDPRGAVLLYLQQALHDKKGIITCLSGYWEWRNTTISVPDATMMGEVWGRLKQCTAASAVPGRSLRAFGDY